MAAAASAAPGPPVTLSPTFQVSPWNGVYGPNPAIAGFRPGQIPQWLIDYVVATYGQTGGGISIF